MRKILLALLAIPALVSPARADFTGKDASAATITFKNPGTCTAVVCVPVAQLYDGTNVVTLTTAGADAASNTLTGVPTYARMLQYNGTTWDRWQGAVKAASGAYATGAIVDITGSSATSAHSCSTGGYGVLGCLGQIDDDIKGAVPWLATTAWSTNSYSNGTTNPGAADLHGAPFVDLGAINGVALLAGTGSQGTGSPRVTVATDQATNAGAALVKGGVGVVNGGSTYIAVAASQTATVLQTSTGATGDYLSHCTIYPTSTSPGVVTVFDNTNTAANSAILFPGGASSLSNLVPFAIPVGAVSANGAWKVTTGASVSVVCEGKFS